MNVSSSPSFSVLWLQAGSCGGCSQAALGATPDGLAAMLERAGIDLLWHPSFSEAGGREVLDLLERCRTGEQPFDLLCVEGTVLRGPAGTGKFQMLSGSGHAMAWWIAELAHRARYVAAVGSCAAFGGIPAFEADPAEACGLQYAGEEMGGLLGDGWRAASGLPVVNIPGCAPHPGWLMETVMALADGGFSTQHLDRYARPRFFSDHLAHHGCARNEYYEFKASAAQTGNLGCLMENLGCMGTQAPGDCSLRQWNGGQSCPNAGYACINCTSPGFESPLGGFLETPKVAGIPVGLPLDMPKAWFVALSALSKSATPDRVRRNARSDRVVVPPQCRTET